MSIRFLTFLLFMLIAAGMQAQSLVPQVVNSAGQQASYLSITHEWSVGELVLVESMINTDNSLTNGFLQPYKVWDSYTLNGFNIQPANLITVNNDGENDFWTIKNIDAYPENEVSIYDRSGKLVFFQKNYMNSFNGFSNNKVLNQDTYYYVIKLTKSDKYGYVKGFLTIITN